MQATEPVTTFLFDKIIFGPVKSRRLGLSLGVNLLPVNVKLCNFNCIYCECGWSGVRQTSPSKFIPADEVKEALMLALTELAEKNIVPDTITFAGNGEPTMHPDFSKIVKDTIKLRNKFFPASKIAVLTNATMLNKKSVVDALKKVDLRILKLDAGTEEMFNKLNIPNSRRTLRWVVNHLKYFKGDLIVQTMFLKGTSGGVYIDNTTDENVKAWLNLLQEIMPKQVMLYSIDRETAEKGLEKISEEKLNEIAAKVNELGIKTAVY